MAIKTQKDADAAADGHEGAQKDYPIDGAPGLVLRCGTRGAAYQLRVRVQGGQVRKAIGHHPATKLRDAKRAAGKLRAEAADGRLKKSRDPGKTVQAMADGYLELHRNPRTRKTYDSLIRTHIIPAWGTRQASDVRHDEVQRWLDDKVMAGHQALAASLYAVFGSMCRYGESRGYVEASPMRKVQRPQPADSRSTVPADTELAAIWRAAGDFGGPYGHYYRFTMATGLRRSAAAGLRWSWVSWGSRTVTIPAGQTGLKQKQGAREDFVLPLNDLALGVLQEVEAWQAAQGIGGDWVFSYDGRGAIHSFSWAAQKIRVLMMLNEEPGAVRDDLRQHDFRRAIATRAAEAEADEPIGHGGLAQAAHVATGHRPGDQVMRTYNRASLVPVRRRALDWWGKYLANILADD